MRSGHMPGKPNTHTRSRFDHIAYAYRFEDVYENENSFTHENDHQNGHSDADILPAMYRDAYLGSLDYDHPLAHRNLERNENRHPFYDTDLEPYRYAELDPDLHLFANPHPDHYCDRDAVQNREPDLFHDSQQDENTDRNADSDANIQRPRRKRRLACPQ